MDPLSEAEILDLVVAMGVFAKQDEVVYAKYLFETVTAKRAALVQVYYDSLVASMSGVADAAVLAEAEALAWTAAASLQRDFVRSELAKVGAVISDGIAAGKHPFEVARLLTLVDKLDRPRAAKLIKYAESLEGLGLSPEDIAKKIELYKKALLEERRKTIARTEMRKAVATADTLQATESGAKYKVWQSTGDSDVSDECEANEAEGPIPIRDSFSGGVGVPPQHPNCRCSVSYIFNDAMKEQAEARADLRSAKTAAAKQLKG